jgi:hypothetical protein
MMLPVGSVSVCICPFALSLSKGDFSEPSGGSCFDKLSTNGKLRHGLPVSKLDEHN